MAAPHWLVVAPWLASPAVSAAPNLGLKCPQYGDEEGTDISGASNPKLDGAINGRFNPGGAAVLSAFDGIDASGEWRLSITDDAGGDTGTLFGWSLIFGF